MTGAVKCNVYIYEQLWAKADSHVLCFHVNQGSDINMLAAVVPSTIPPRVHALLCQQSSTLTQAAGPMHHHPSTAQLQGYHFVGLI